MGQVSMREGGGGEGPGAGRVSAGNFWVGVGLPQG